MTVKLRASRCPACGVVCDAASARECPQDAVMPEPGDLTVCIYCSTFLKFTDDLDLALLVPTELRALPAEEQNRLWEIRRIVHAMPPELRRRRK